jgi:hypothetical protein
MDELTVMMKKLAELVFRHEQRLNDIEDAS